MRKVKIEPTYRCGREMWSTSMTGIKIQDHIQYIYAPYSYTSTRIQPENSKHDSITILTWLFSLHACIHFFSLKNKQWLSLLLEIFVEKKKHFVPGIFSNIILSLQINLCSCIHVDLQISGGTGFRCVQIFQICACYFCLQDCEKAWVTPVITVHHQRSLRLLRVVTIGSPETKKMHTLILIRLNCTWCREYKHGGTMKTQRKTLRNHSGESQLLHM